MTESKRRPAGVLALGWLHILGGSAALVAFAAGFLTLVPRDPQRSGIPAELLLGVALLAFLGPVVGAGLLKGRPWSWYAASFTYVLAAVAGGLALFQRRGAPEDPALPPEVWTALPPALAIVGTAALVVALGGAVVAFCGLKGRTRWIALPVEIGLCACLVYGVHSVVLQRDVEPAAGAIARLHHLGEMRANGEEEIGFMLDRLADGGTEERASAAWALGRAGRGDVLPELLSAARNDRDVNVRINAIGSVGELGGVEILDDLLGFLNDDEGEVQSAALRALADKRFAGAVQTVGRFLRDNEPLRASAVDALGNMGSASALPFLREVTGDTDEDVRSRVAFAFGKIGDRRALPALIELLGDPHWTVRANAAQALGSIGDRSVRPKLAAMRDDPNSQVRATAEAALEKLR